MCLSSFFFFPSTTHRLFFNKFQLGDGGGGSARKKWIMGATACIQEEQCIGPGSGGGMWRRLRSSPACLNQRFQKPERVGERAAPPGGQTVFDALPSLLSPLCSGEFFFRQEPKWRWWCIQVLMDTNCGDGLCFFFFQFNFRPALIFCCIFFVCLCF